MQVCNKGSRQSEHHISGIKLRNLAFYLWKDASLWAHRIHFFHVHLSYLGPILFPCSPCFLYSSSSSAITMWGGGGNACWIAVLGAIIHIWRPEITDGCDIVVASCSRKQTHSGQCRQWSAIHYTGGPKAESPLSQGPRPVFVETLYTLSVHAQTHLLKFSETSLNKQKERYKVNQ